MPEWGKHTFFHTFPAVSFQTRPQQTLLWSWKQPEPQLCEDKETGSTCSYTATAVDLAAFQQEPEPRYNVGNIMTSSGHLKCIITYRERETEKEQSEMSCPLVETYLCQLSQLLGSTITHAHTWAHTPHLALIKSSTHFPLRLYLSEQWSINLPSILFSPTELPKWILAFFSPDNELPFMSVCSADGALFQMNAGQRLDISYWWMDESVSSLSLCSHFVVFWRRWQRLALISLIQLLPQQG